MTERQHAHADANHQSATHDDEAIRISRHASSLSAPEAPIASGLLLRKADGNGVHEDADGAVATAAQSTGSALPGPLMRKFEDALGADLSSVRVHTGDASQAAAQSVGARAYTVGQDIHFGAGQYDPGSAGGEHLLAHEVAHTVQQQGGTPVRQNKLEVSAPHDAAEHEADRAADAMVSGASAAIAGSSFAGAQRQKAPGATEPKATDGKLSAAEQVQLIATRQNISQSYGFLLQNQRDGLGDLQEALKTPDEPSITEQAMSFMIQAALGAAFGALGGVVGAAVGKYAGVAVKALAAKAAGAAMDTPDIRVPGFTDGELSGSTALAEKLAASLSKKIEDGIKGAFSGLAAKASASVQGQPTIQQFISGQRKALTDAAILASRTFNNNQEQLTATPEGLAAALAIDQALGDAIQKAEKEQFMASLVEWSRQLNTSNGRESGMICIDCTMDTPQSSAGGFKSTWQGVNQAARKIVTKTYLDRSPAEIGAGMQIKIKTKNGLIFLTRSARNATLNYPTSGHEYAFLVERGGGKPNEQNDNVASLGATLLFNDISNRKFAELALATD